MRERENENLEDKSEENRSLKEDVKVLQRNESKLNFPQILRDSSSKYPTKANKSSPSSLSSSYKILPPITNFEQVRFRDDDNIDLLESSQGELCDEETAFDTETKLSDFCKIRMRKVSERTLNIMLMEMRKLDRDRERIIHSSTLDNLVQKYKLPISPCLSKLKQKFEDETLPGFTNYEHLVR